MILVRLDLELVKYLTYNFEHIWLKLHNAFAIKGPRIPKSDRQGFGAGIGGCYHSLSTHSDGGLELGRAVIVLNPN